MAPHKSAAFFLQQAETLSLEPTPLVFTDKQLMSHVVVIPTKLHYREQSIFFSLHLLGTLWILQTQ